MAIDERLIKALHIESLRRSDLGAGGAPHELIRASTIEALLDGAYDGDVSFRELARHGDLGLGTFDAVDGEMLAIDGEFLRADVDGALHPVDPRRKTPFAVVTFFDPTHEFELAAKLDPKAFLEALDERIGDPRLGHALRIEGRFKRVRARSVPRQRKPYPPMTEVVAEQRVFELRDVEGTMVGFRFPDFASGVEVPGYHLHFATADRARGRHVLEAVPDGVTVRVDDSSDLELPPGVELGRLGAGPARGREPGLSPRLRGEGSAPGSPGRPRTRPGR